jgi:hypothetical protein
VLTLVAALLASQVVVTPPDPGTSAPVAEGAQPTAPMPQVAEPASNPAGTINDDDPGEPPTEFNDEATEEEGPTSQETQAPDTESERAASAGGDKEDAVVAAPSSPASPSPPSPAAPCPVNDTARALSFGGLAVGGVSLLAAVTLAAVSLYERTQAQDLLDHSPAFGTIGDRYVERDPAHPDVAAYDSHRAASSILSQLSWFALGLSLAGAGIAGSAFWLGEQSEACRAR